MDEKNRKFTLIALSYVLIIALVLIALKLAIVFSFVLFMIFLFVGIPAPGKIRIQLLIAAFVFLGISLVQRDGEIPFSFSEISHNFKETIEDSNVAAQTAKERVELERCVNNALEGEYVSITTRAFGEALELANRTESAELKNYFSDNLKGMITNSYGLMIKMGSSNVSYSSYTPQMCRMIHRGLCFLGYDNAEIDGWQKLADLAAWRRSEIEGRRFRKWPELKDEALGDGFEVTGDLDKDFALPELPF